MKLEQVGALLMHHKSLSYDATIQETIEAQSPYQLALLSRFFDELVTELLPTVDHSSQMALKDARSLRTQVETELLLKLAVMEADSDEPF